MSNKARHADKNGRWKGIPFEIEPLIITSFLLGLSPYIISVRIRISYKDKISPNRIRNFLKSKGISWRDWKKHRDLN
jgi:hypothetical protein